jgi:hypothetical protein
VNGLGVAAGFAGSFSVIVSTGTLEEFSPVSVSVVAVPGEAMPVSGLYVFVGVAARVIGTCGTTVKSASTVSAFVADTDATLRSGTPFCVAGMVGSRRTGITIVTVLPSPRPTPPAGSVSSSLKTTETTLSSPIDAS